MWAVPAWFFGRASGARTGRPAMEGGPPRRPPASPPARPPPPPALPARAAAEAEGKGRAGVPRGSAARRLAPGGRGGLASDRLFGPPGAASLAPQRSPFRTPAAARRMRCAGADGEGRDRGRLRLYISCHMLPKSGVGGRDRGQGRPRPAGPGITRRGPARRGGSSRGEADHAAALRGPPVLHKAGDSVARDLPQAADRAALELHGQVTGDQLDEAVRVHALPL